MKNFEIKVAPHAFNFLQNSLMQAFSSTTSYLQQLNLLITSIKSSRKKAKAFFDLQWMYVCLQTTKTTATNMSQLQQEASSGMRFAQKCEADDFHRLSGDDAHT